MFICLKTWEDPFGMVTKILLHWKQSDNLKGKLKGPQSDEHRLAISLGGKGIKKVKTHGANVAKANIGNISINKDNTEKKVKKDTLQSYLNDGWQLGGKKRKIA